MSSPCYSSSSGSPASTSAFETVMRKPLPHLPLEILDMVVSNSDTSMYYTYTQVSSTFRRLAYENITRDYDRADNSQKVDNRLAMHLVNNQKPAVPGEVEEGRWYAPRWFLLGGCKGSGVASSECSVAGWRALEGFV